MARQLTKELIDQNDPRILGNGKIFDQYKYANPNGINFYERYQEGEKLNSSWVNPTDFEKP